MPGVGKVNCTNFELDTSTVEREKTRRTRLYYTALTANLAFFSCGASLSWTSPTLPQLQSEQSWLKGVDNEVASLIASFLMLGAAVGPVVAGLLLNNVGRKKTLISSTALHLFSWIVLGFAASAEVIYLARFIQGVAVAIVFTAVPMYVGEIAERTMRAALASSSEVFLALGYMLEYSIGPYVGYTILIFVSSIMPLVTFILFFCIPESPHFMLAKGNKNKAMKDLRWLRGNVSVTAAKREIAMIQASLEQGLHSGQQSKFQELIGSPGCVKALYLSCGLMLLQQFSGINVVLFYAQPIFMKTGASLSPSVSAMIVGAVQLISACITPALVKRFGFKTPLAFSALGMCLAQGILGMYFFFEDLKYDMQFWGWLPVTSLMLYIHVYCLGFGPLPWAFLGEIFPPNVKEFASGLCTSFSFFLAFLITKFFVNISDILGTYAAFWIFSGFCVFAFLFVLFLMPNTRGLSLPEIQDLLNGRPITRLDRIPEEAPVKNAGTNNLI
ncbi:facilitated trehalose transporter Tret1-like [Lycorma delicatula]|uniref:facilitated trehalose transporter Tret1-like n=1 Tax=Lycorma delicatula TaxID=130591 RepID=UPI003F50EE46